MAKKGTIDESALLGRLWASFAAFAEAQTPPPVESASPVHLPLQDHRLDPCALQLSTYLERLLSALGSSLDDHSLFLDVLLWEPFLPDSADNWALSGVGINRIDDPLRAYLRAIEDLGTNVFDFFYNQLPEKLPLKIAVPPSAGDVGPIGSTPDVDKLLPNVGSCERTKSLFEKALANHKEFAVSGAWTYVYYVPSEFHAATQTGIGGLVWVSPLDLSKVFIWQLKTMMEATLSKIGVNYLFARQQQSALQAGFAAIMSRNLSHNVGSHGLTHLLNESLGGDDEEGAKKFLSYAKDRMDFVAEVTTYWRELRW